MKNAAEILRLLNNMIRIGTIEEIDHKAFRVRVISGDNLTDWVPWRAARAGKTKTWDPPTKGEQVVLLSPSGDMSQAIVLQSLYSDENPPPNASENLWLKKFPDGTEIRYDHAAKKLHIDGAGELQIDVKGNAAINAKTIALNKGVGVVTGAHICAYTGSPHADCSKTVTAGI